jgi:hypothetical protein
MRIDESFRRLTDGENWDGLELRPRTSSSQRRRVPLLFQVVTVAVVGVVVGVVVTFGVSAVRPQLPDIATTSTSAPVEFTQTKGVTTGAQLTKMPDEGFYAEWGHNHENFTIVTWGSSGCPWTPTDIRADDATMTVTFAEAIPADEGDIAICADTLVPTSTTFPTPSAVDETLPVDLTVVLGTKSYDRSLYFEATDIACTSDMIAARISASELVDGVQYQDLELTNSSDESCNMGGPMTLTFGDPDPVGDSFDYEPPFDDTSGLTGLSPGAVRFYRIGLFPAPADCNPRPSWTLRVDGPGDYEVAVADWQLNVCTKSGEQDFTITGPTAARTVSVNGWQD